MPALNQTQICNRALAMLPAGRIVDISENSLEARECGTFYPMAMSDMLEGAHNWSFATRRVALAQLATNDREAEWGYAYQLPANAAGSGSMTIIPDYDSLGLGLPVPLSGEPYMETWASQLVDLQIPFLVEGGTLYTNTADASLAYVIDDISGVNVPQLVITAVTLDLASRLAVPIKKDSNREKELQAAAEVAWQRAIADDQNRQPTQRSTYVPDAMKARAGHNVEGL
jgi:hypothetical protein